MDVGVWLRSLGLGQYEAPFRDNEIDGAVLPRLTVDDLKDLGVAVVGHRRKIMSAIEELNAASVVRADAMKPPQMQAPPSVGASSDGAERRPITVMFCDLVGSTSMAAKLDAEDWRTLVNTYLDEASAAVTALGGHVLKKLGDGLMALFGYPHAQENDAERAVRAALAIQRALVEINARNASRGAPELSARIGLDSGQVVVDATGEVFGDAPNIAARVQSAAGPGSILITGAVQRQTAGLFVAEDRGQHELKGMSTPMTLYRVVRASGGGRRGGARALTPLVGREEELDLLTRRWDRARQGEGQLALIVGEPGLGKSRLIEEFHGRLGETPYTWVEWSSSQLLQNTPLHPIAEWGRQRFGADLPAEQRLTDLEHTLRLVGLDPTEYAPLLAPLVDVLLPEDRAAKLAPEELRRRQLAAMMAWVLASARTQPAVVAFEDLHWADPTSLDLMRGLAERGAQAPLLIIATTRPEFRPPWSVRSHHSAISLSPLDRMQIAKMVAELAAHHALPRGIVEGVSERTGGVPLFVEEVTRLLLERGEQGGAQAIPPTLQQSLAARLDRLGSARETAQIGAVLGRGFSYALLQSVAGLDGGALQSTLERLAEADILFVEGDGAQATYRFKHALIQDAAYDSLLKSRRQALHARAAEILHESAAPEPEAIAHHFTQAGLDDLAIEWWGKAGDQALRRSAFQEAIAHLGKAIAMADKAAAGTRGVEAAVAENGEVTVSERFRRQRLQVAYGNALIAARGHTAPETTEAFAKVRESEAGGADVRELAAADYGLWVASYGRGELPPMRVHSTAFLEDVAARLDSVEACVAHRVAGSTHWFAGEYREAREHLERAVALFQPGRDDDVAFRFGQDAGVAATLYLAIVLWVLGDVARAIALAQQAHERIERIPHVNTRAYGKLHMALFELIRGEVSRAVPNALELGRVARENDLPLFRALAEFLEPWAKSQTAGSADAREEMSRAANVLRERNIRCFDGPLKLAHAQEEARLGDPERAISIVDDAKADFDRRGHRAIDAELRRVRGEILLKRDPANPGPAEEALKSAIAIAKQQGARSFELRAALSLAKLHCATHRDAEAHAVLAPALEGFSPTPEMPEIAEAQALLSALAKIEGVREALEKRQTRAKIHLDYARAVQWAKGWGAEEARAAVERAHEFAAPTPGHPDYWSLAYGRFAVALLRGEFRAALEIAETYLRQAEVEGRPDHAVNARRLLGTVKLELGAFSESRRDFEELVTNWDEERDKHLCMVTGADVLCVGWAYMAQLMVILGEVDDAVRMSEGAIRRAESLGDFGSLAFALGLSLFVLATCGRNEATLRRAEAFEAKASEKGARLWESIAREWASTARGLVTGDAAAATELRDIMAARRERQERQSANMGHGVLAQLQGKAGMTDEALASVAEGFALAEQTGGHRTDSFLHRVRGDILAERDPSAAEASYREALRIAQSQGARTFELQAAHALAKLHQSTGRSTDAHSVLAPALEGFEPTPEMPEIAEAAALLAALTETDEVKADKAQRERRAQLQLAMATALFHSRGMQAPETLAAFEKAGGVGTEIADPIEQLAAVHGVWMGEFARGDVRRMLEIAPSAVAIASLDPAGRGAVVANRVLGVTRFMAGDLAAADESLRWAADHYEFDRDSALAVPFGLDQGAASRYSRAFAQWMLGDGEAAERLIAEAKSLADRVRHPPTSAAVFGLAAWLDNICGDHEKALANAERSLALACEFGMPLWRANSEFWLAWSKAGLNGTRDVWDEVNAALDAAKTFDVAISEPMAAYIAEGYARFGDFGRSLALVDRALTGPAERGLSVFLPEAHRVRGDMLFKRDPENPVAAERSLQTAIAIACEQGSRAFGLRAGLSLAKLYQSTGRPVEAHAVLAPALEGFAPTSKMPEIAEAVSLLPRLA